MTRVLLVPSSDRAASLAQLRRVERWATDGCSAEELAEGCTLLDVLEDGVQVGVIALEVKGAFAFISAAAGNGRQTNVAEALRLAEAIAMERGARRIAMLTRRPGLVRNLMRAGYAIHQAELMKDL